MFLSDLSIKRPIMISMVLLVFLLFGGLAYFTLNLNLMPDIEIPFITIQTVYPGAGPEEIETLVTKKLEDAVSTVSQIKYVRSYSMEGGSILIIRFELDKDVDIANQEVKDKVGAIANELPKDAETPVIEKFDITDFPIMDVLLSGDMELKDLYDLADKRLKDRLSQVEGVARVDMTGGQEREIRVELDNTTVFNNKISLAQLSQVLAAHNLDIPGGHFTRKTQEYTVRFKGEFADVATLRQAEIPTAHGAKKLGHLARIVDTGAEIRERAIYYNNETKQADDNVILLSLYKSSDGNVVKMAEGVAKVLPDIQSELPKGCSLTIINDDSVFIKSTVEDTLSNIILGIILTGLVLLFFLHDLRSTIIVALAMPMSMLSTFMLMQASNFSLNIMTLMGLSTSVGILVANSVVVLENIFRHKEMGHKRKEAAARGTAEIAVAVIASTLTNIVVFLPIASMTSMVGQFFKEFALTVTFATIFSLLISFTLTPMLASLILPEKKVKKKHPIGKALEAMFHSWERFYQGMLGVALKNKIIGAAVVLMALAVFVLGLVVGAKVGFEFMPKTDEGDISIEVELPQGYNLEATSALLKNIEERIRKHPEVKHIVTTMGALSQVDEGTNMAKMNVKLVDAETREHSSDEMAYRFIQDVATVPNASIRVAALSSVGGGGDAPVQFYLQGQDMDTLEGYKTQLVKKLEVIPGLINLNTSSRPGKPEITLIPDRDKLAQAQATVYDLAMVLRAAVEGVVDSHYREAGNEYDIRVILAENATDSPEKIENLAVHTPVGTYRMSQLADVRFTEGYSKVLHQDKFKAIEFSGYPGPGVALGNITTQVDQAVADLNLPSGYKMKWGGDAEMMGETIVDMARTFIIAMVLTYMLLAAILESLFQPLLILGTVPLALLGVFSALYLTGLTMNTISMMAIVMLVGIVVNNAILLLDYTNQLKRHKGLNTHDALVEACPTKLKPILMSTIAIILGMSPMALGIGAAGAEIRQPMGVVSIGGLIVSTIMALIVIPVLYNLFSKINSRRSQS